LEKNPSAPSFLLTILQTGRGECLISRPADYPAMLPLVRRYLEATCPASRRLD
jgi:hypothetical protein